MCLDPGLEFPPFPRPDPLPYKQIHSALSPDWQPVLLLQKRRRDQVDSGDRQEVCHTLTISPGACSLSSLSLHLSNYNMKIKSSFVYILQGLKEVRYESTWCVVRNQKQICKFGLIIILDQWSSKCSPLTNSFSNAWELVRDAHSQAPAQTC